jgi:hypothetical protein
MPIAIRDLNSGLFFNGGQWTAIVEWAQCFRDRQTVERVAFEYKIEKAEMVFMDDGFRPVGWAFIHSRGSQ